MPVATELCTAANIYKRNQEFLAKAIDGLSEEQWQQRPGESSSCALWIVGHIVWARSRALQFIGYTWTQPWLNLFARGSKPADADQYPSAAELLDAWEDLCTSLPAALEEVHEDVLSKPVQQPSPSFDGTVGGMISFLAMHESYHVGQVVYLRRLLGHDKVVG
jgi:uncharacterized damage-inducible protein DinB